MKSNFHYCFIVVIGLTSRKSHRGALTTRISAINTYNKYTVQKYVRKNTRNLQRIRVLKAALCSSHFRFRVLKAINTWHLFREYNDISRPYSFHQDTQFVLEIFFYVDSRGWRRCHLTLRRLMCCLQCQGIFASLCIKTHDK